MGNSSNNKKTIEESKIEEASIIIIKIIDFQKIKSICKLIDEGYNFGIGFFCKILSPDKFNTCLNHIKNEKSSFENVIYNQSFKDEKNSEKFKIVTKRKFYGNELINYTLIEIFPKKDKLNNYLELNKNKECVYNKLYNSQFKLIDIEGFSSETETLNYNIYYKIIQESLKKDGDSSFPIVLFEIPKMIGLYNEDEERKNYNYKNLLEYAFIRFNEKRDNETENEIIFHIKIDEEEKNKDIYILNYPYYKSSDGIRREANELKEMNKSNTLMFINGKKVDYEKYKKFDKKGIYEIKLKLKIDLVNAYCMFLGCKNIIDINLSKFKTDKINNMCAMFRDCTNLKNIDLSFFDTRNVTNMNSMFNGCKKLKYINLSSFDTTNVTDMRYMFNGCNELINIDLSSFDTKSVADMAGMFEGCKKLQNLELKYFCTKNVIDMSKMFRNCSNLEKINLSSFDTKNAIDTS